MAKYKKLGHQSSDRNYFTTKKDRCGFSRIEVHSADPNLKWYERKHYCLGIHIPTDTFFLYNEHEQERLLYAGLPCIYTDKDYHARDDKNSIFWSRSANLSLKAIKRIVKKIHNFPKGNRYVFSREVYYVGKNVSLDYVYRPKNSKQHAINYKVNASRFTTSSSIIEQEWARLLVDRLRENGFNVSISESNPHRLIDMFRQAAALSGENVPELEDDEKDISVVAYGKGVKLGFTPNKSPLFGYSMGEDNILIDKFGEFDKWSRCVQIAKSDDVDHLINRILEFSKPNTND